MVVMYDQKKQVTKNSLRLNVRPSIMAKYQTLILKTSKYVTTEKKRHFPKAYDSYLAFCYIYFNSELLVSTSTFSSSFNLKSTVHLF